MQYGWEVLPIHTEIVIPGVGIVNLSHMPYASDKTDQRYQEYRPIDNGRWLLCGHIHEKWRQLGRMINVGVDVYDYRPVAMEAIAAQILLSEGSI